MDTPTTLAVPVAVAFARKAERDAVQLVSAREAARLLDTTAGTLSQWRTHKKPGLPYVKLAGRSVRYRLADINAFINARLVGAGVA